MNAKELHEYGAKVFDKRSGLMSLWQEFAMHFYPERADFMWQRSLGTEFASHLMTSYPILVRRELGDQITTMLRPTQKSWFHMTTMDERVQKDNEARAWMEWASTVMRRAMYDRKALFTKALKQADHDFACFGQAVVSIELSRDSSRLLYRCWHLRDVAWLEDPEGNVCGVFRKWKPGIRDLRKTFPRTTNGEKYIQAEKKDPTTEIECMHMVVESDMWTADMTGPKMMRKTPYVSVFYDVTHENVLEAVGVFDTIYVIPRWQTVSGSQYAYSPATVAALPEARLLQAMTYTLLEAGEKATNPPLVADQNIFRSDVALYAGGISWADLEGDQKLSDRLHVFTNDKSGMPIGIEMQKDSRMLIADCFYLNALKPFNPTTDPEMTAFQAGQIVQDYIRKALPLFEPMEDDYNGGVCEFTFNTMMRAGAFGPPQNMPRQLRGVETIWRFESPLHDSIEKMKVTTFLQTKQLLAEAAAMDPAAVQVVDAVEALRDALQGGGTPASWMRSQTDIEEAKRQHDAAQEADTFLAAAQAGADVSKTISETQKNVSAVQGPATVQ